MNLAAGIREIVSAKGISEELVMDTVKDILTKAYQKFKGVNEIKIVQELDKNILDVFVVKQAVGRVTDKVNQILIREAAELLGQETVEKGELVDYRVNPITDFKEKEIAWVSENIMNRINNIEKDVIKYEYENKRNKLVSGTIVKIDERGNIYVDLGKTIALLPAANQSPVEHYEMDDMIKAVVRDVISGRGKRSRNKKDLNPSNVQIFLSRTSPELVRELLNQDIPEIGEGTIEIKRIVREPGYKTKVAVASDTIEPVAPCIGPHGVRITNVVKELGGEKIDVVRYSDDSDSFIKNALTPAKVERIIVQDESSKMVFAVVGMDQLAYAYGKQKKNVILAARLTGWKINIKTEAEIDEEQIESADVKELKNMFIDGTPLDELPGLGEDIIAALQENDVHTVESLVEVDEISGYANLSGLSEDQIKKIKKVLSESVEVEVEGEEGGTDTPNEEDDEGTSLGMLPDFNKKWIEKLKTAGITSIEELVDASQSGRLPGVEGLDAEEVKAIQAVLAENVEVED